MNDQESDYSSTEGQEFDSDDSFSKSDNSSDIKPKQQSSSIKSSQSNKNDQNKILVLCKKGVSSAIRHFLPVFNSLILNPIKSPKFRGKHYVMLNKIADEKDCSMILLFETRHSTEHYLWFALPPGGPTMCFFFENFHSIEELHLIGKCTPDTRPLLFFDPIFKSTPTLGIAKELLKQTFGSTYSKSQKIVDTAISFLYKDDHIWVRRYQILFDQDPPRLMEAGPRFCLQPVLILPGSFQGKEIYRNKNFIPPHKKSRVLKKPSSATEKNQKYDPPENQEK